MRSLARFSVIGIVGLGLGAAPTAWGQDDAKAHAAAPPSARPTPENDASASPSSSGESMVTPSASARTQTSPGATPAKADEQKPVGGGYSWSEKRNRPSKGKRQAPLDPRRPLAQAPNFELRPDGSSAVTLLLSHETQVTRAGQDRRVEYRLKGAQVGVANNMNPLITAHFATPVVRVVLRRSNDDAVLILELRENVQPTHQILSGPAGGAMLEVTLPKPSHAYLAPREQGQVQQSSTKTSRPDSEPKRRRTAKHQAGKVGPGPRL
jgi:hypothetical protein